MIHMAYQATQLTKLKSQMAHVPLFPLGPSHTHTPKPLKPQFGCTLSAKSPTAVV